MSTLKQILESAANDPRERARLQANPASAFSAAGIEIPAGTTVEFLESGPELLHLVLGRRVAVPELDRALERAEREPAYKQRLLAQPKSTIEEALGTRLPDRVQVRIHENQPERWLIPLPPVRRADGELSDAELETVAGGGLIKRIGQAIGNALCGNSTEIVSQQVTKNHGVKITTVDWSVTEERTIDTY